MTLASLIFSGRDWLVPVVLLAALTTVTRPDARLVCCVPNMTHISIVERLLRGDLGSFAAASDSHHHDRDGERRA